MAKKNQSNLNNWKSKIVGHEKIAASQLLANPFNHRRHPEKQRNLVSASIKELGFIKSVIVNRNTGHIVDGHERVMQALTLKEDTLVDVEYIELSLEEEKKALLILDSSSELAVADANSLKQLIADCSFDLEALNVFAKDMLEAVSPRVEPEVHEDEIPPTPSECMTHAGSIWLLGKHRLLCGDSTSQESVRKLLGETQIDCLLTDPPYNVDYTGKTKDALKVENDSMDDASFREFLCACFGLAFSNMKSGASFYIFHADSEGYNFRGAVKDCGEVVRQCLIWLKNCMVMGRQDYQWKHEPCLYGWKAGSAHAWHSDRKQTTVLEFDRPSRSEDHPTMKPVKMIGYLMANSTEPEQVVYDPFLGSGTTLIAAEQLGRKCYGMEISPRYCDVIVKRWENLTGQKAVLEQGVQ